MQPFHRELDQGKQLALKKPKTPEIKGMSPSSWPPRLSGVPGRLPDFVEPMKAKLVDSMRSSDWIYEIKFDGYRAMALRGGNETRVESAKKSGVGISRG